METGTKQGKISEVAKAIFKPAWFFSSSVGGKPEISWWTYVTLYNIFFNYMNETWSNDCQGRKTASKQREQALTDFEKK